jgi:hypothetical protein
METESCSSAWSQEPSTGSYPEPILILPNLLCFGLPSGLFTPGFPINILYAFLFPSSL